MSTKMERVATSTRTDSPEDPEEHVSDQPPNDRPDQGGPPSQGQGSGNGPPPGVGWPEPNQGQPPSGDPGGQPPYGQPYGGQPYGASPKNGMGTAALVLGIIAIILAVFVFPLGILLGVIAAVLGYLGRKKAARREATNGGQATAGLVLGLVAVLVGGLIAAFVGNFIADNSDEIGNLSDCLADAGTESERAACQEEFEGELGG